RCLRLDHSGFVAIAPCEISRSTLPDHGPAEQFRSHVAQHSQLIRADGLKLDAIFGVFLWIIDPATIPDILPDRFGIADDLDAASLLVRRVLEQNDGPTRVGADFSIFDATAPCRVDQNAGSAVSECRGVAKGGWQGHGPHRQYGFVHTYLPLFVTSLLIEPNASCPMW